MRSAGVTDHCLCRHGRPTKSHPSGVRATACSQDGALNKRHRSPTLARWMTRSSPAHNDEKWGPPPRCFLQTNTARGEEVGNFRRTKRTIPLPASLSGGGVQESAKQPQRLFRSRSGAYDLGTHSPPAPALARSPPFGASR
jgi:hypothetical protein